VQGPLLGIFFTGPIAFCIGVIGGLISASRRITIRGNIYLLFAASVLVAGATLYMSMAEPLKLGIVIDAEIRNCRSPELLTEQAIKRWKEIISISQNRLSWGEINVPNLLKKDQGVILDLLVYRRKEIRKHRKLWNYGQIEVTAWHEENAPESFHAGFAGASCADYVQQPRRLYFSESYFTPHTTVDTLLGLDILEFIPKEYQHKQNN